MGLSLLILLLGSLFLVSGVHRAARTVQHSDEVRVALLRLQGIVLDAETGARGYAAAGHPQLLQSYTDAMCRYRGALETLRDLTRNDAAERGQVALLEPIVDHELAVLKALIDAHSHGAAGDELVPLLMAGKGVMDDIRNRIGELFSKEEDLEVRGLHDESTVTIVTVGALAAALGLLVGGAVWLAQREALLEREQEAREQAERASGFAELFVAVLGHDLRNPLSAITLAAGTLARTAQEERARAMGTNILTSAGRMRRMIEQILDFSRIRAGQGLSHQPAPMDLRELIARVRDELRGRKAIEVSAEGATDGVWDQDGLSQVFSNLLANAVEHSPEGSMVRVKIDGRQPDRVEVGVENPGVISPDVLARVFEPFRRVRTQEKTKGLGLGLFITREIVRTHGGSIAVTSSEGAGTRFQVILPRSSSPARTPAEAPPKTEKRD